MRRKQSKPAPAGALIRQLRKPVPPPTRVSVEERKYNRAREHERLRRGR